MISRKEFANYQLEMEKRFSQLEKEVQALKHQLEIEKLKVNINNPTPSEPTKEEKEAAKKEVEEQNRVFNEWSEDQETLVKLGFKKD